MQNDTYPKFLIMLGASFVIMYSVMFLNVAAAEHIHVSLTRTYMALLIVAPMALLMMLMMGHMYPNEARDRVIMGTGTLVFVAALVVLRVQVPIGDKQYMKAMIPHHSSAILTSGEATLKDPEVQELAKSIVEAQKREVAQMEAILARMENEE